MMRDPENPRFRVAISVLVSVAVMSCLSVSAYGGNIVVDGDFELADLGTGSGTDSFAAGETIDGGSWVVSQGTVGVDTHNFFVFDLEKSIFLDGSGTGPDSLTQTLTTVAGETYIVSFWANADTSNTVSVTLGGATVTGAPFSILQNGFPDPSPLGNSGRFTFYSGTVTATSTSSDLVLAAKNLGNDSNHNSVEIDDVSVTGAGASVPEPSTFAFAAIGMGVGLAARRRRRLFR